MLKKEIFLHTNKMYVFHKNWLTKLQKIQMGTKIPKNDVDFSIIDCSFCRWYKANDSSIFSSYFKKISKNHKRIHHIFQTIKKKGIKEEVILGTSYYTSVFDNLNAKEQAMILAFFKDLKKEHNQISTTIRELQQTILIVN